MSKKKVRRKRSSQTAVKSGSSKQQWMLYAGIGVAAIVLIAFFVFLNRGGKSEAEPLADAATLALGEAIYTQNCASCHGSAGDGHAAEPQAPALNDREHAWHHPDGQLQQVIMNGGQIMPPFKDKLTTEETVAVVRYIQGWWRPDQLRSQQAQSRQAPFQE